MASVLGCEIDEKKFLSQIEISDGCWAWLGATRTGGYGEFWSDSPKRLLASHRISWGLHFGDIPEGLSVLHKCDNPRCVNPEHLFVGTQADNIHDMVRKGRKRGGAPTGEKHFRAVLSSAASKELLEATGTIREISRRFSVSLSTVKRVRAKTHWSIKEVSDGKEMEAV